MPGDRGHECEYGLGKPAGNDDSIDRELALLRRRIWEMVQSLQ